MGEKLNGGDQVDTDPAQPADAAQGQPPLAPSGGALTSAAILENAAELFSTVGYDGTSVREIAKVVGIKPASLYNHFLSKEEILWGVVRRATLDLESRQREALADVVAPAARLSAFVCTHVRYHATRMRDAKIANVQMYMLSKPHFTAITEFRHQYEMMLQDILRQGRETGAFQVDDVKVASYAILQMGIGVAYWYSPTGPLTVDDLCRMYDRIALKIVTP